MPIGKVTAKTDIKFDNTLYVGGGNFKIVAINPTKEEKEKLYPNRQFTEEPVYLTERDGVKNLRIEFTLASLDIEGLLIPCSFWLRKEKSYGKNSGKTEIIDNYSRTVWLLDNEIVEHKIPVFPDGTPKIDTNYRIALTGESSIIKWMKNVLNIRDVIEFGTNQYIEKPEDAQIYFSTINNWLENGNIQELKDAWMLEPDAVFTAMVGIRNTDRGSFMSVYTGNILKPGNVAGPCTDKKIGKIMKVIDEDKQRGALADTEFEEAFIHEYKVDATKLDEQIKTSMPEDDGLPF